MNAPAQTVTVIGWGSLIWNRECLKLRGRWHRDGPELPVEFARISNDGSLTLVTNNERGWEKQKTYWVVMDFEDVGTAEENLRKREAHGKDTRTPMGVVRGIEARPSEGTIDCMIWDWMKNNGDIDAVIWTALGERWIPRRSFESVEVLAEAALKYMENLERAAKDDEKKGKLFDQVQEYVRKTPPQIDTAVRKLLRDKKGWSDEQLSEELLE